MADVATPSGAAMFDAGAAPEKKKVERPERPDEAVYKKELTKAQKAHEDAKAKFVSSLTFLLWAAHTLLSMHPPELSSADSFLTDIFIGCHAIQA